MRINWKNYIVAFIIILVLFPLVYLVFLSFSSNWPYPNLKPNTFGFQNWAVIFNSEVGLFQSFLNSLSIALSVASASTLLGFLLSSVIAQHRNRKHFLLVSYLPYVLSPVVLAACLSFFFIRTGLFGNLGGVILAQLIICVPYSVIFFDGFWNKQTTSVKGLVATLGGNKFITYQKVLIPMAKGMLLVCFFQTFLISWFEYGLTALIGVGKIQTLTIKVFLFIQESNFYYGALSSCLLVLPPLLLLYFNKKYIFNQIR